MATKRAANDPLDGDPSKRLNTGVAAPGMLTPDQIKAMMEKTKRELEMRKAQLGISTTVQPATAVPMPMQAAGPASALAAQIQARLQSANMQARIAAAYGQLGQQQAPEKKEAAPLNLRLDDQGRLVDALGNVIETRRVTTLKINERADKEQKQDTKRSDASTPVPSELEASAYVDPRMEMPRSVRERRMLSFVEPGKFEEKANKMRMQERLAQLSAEINETAKKTGISSTVKLAVLTVKDMGVPDKVPDIEWWDAAIIKDGTYQGVVDDHPDPKVSAYAAPFSEYAGNEALHSHYQGITSLVEHPIPIEPPAEAPQDIAIPVYLTKEERKKIRRQRRRAAWLEQQEMIRMGLVDAPDPKLKISNLMRVLGDEAVQDPTAMEAKVKAQMDERAAKHAEHNKSATKEEKAAKLDKRLTEDTEQQIHVCVFRVNDISHPQKKYKVDMNAQQYKMTGGILTSPDLNVVVCEGGPRGMRKFKRLMLHRIKWNEDTRKSVLAKREAAEAEEDGDADPVENKCVLVWEGIMKDNVFPEWSIKKFSSSQFAREYLRKMKVEHYWDLAIAGQIIEPDEEDVI